MPQSYFADIPPIQFEGATSENPLAYRYYDKNRVVLCVRLLAGCNCAILFPGC